MARTSKHSDAAARTAAGETDFDVLREAHEMSLQDLADWLSEQGFPGIEGASDGSSTALWSKQLLWAQEKKGDTRVIDIYKRAFAVRGGPTDWLVETTRGILAPFVSDASHHTTPTGLVEQEAAELPAAVATFVGVVREADEHEAELRVGVGPNVDWLAPGHPVGDALLDYLRHTRRAVRLLVQPRHVDPVTPRLTLTACVRALNHLNRQTGDIHGVFEVFELSAPGMPGPFAVTLTGPSAIGFQWLTEATKMVRTAELREPAASAAIFSHLRDATGRQPMMTVAFGQPDKVASARIDLGNHAGDQRMWNPRLPLNLIPEEVDNRRVLRILSRTQGKFQSNLEDIVQLRLRNRTSFLSRLRTRKAFLILLEEHLEHLSAHGGTDPADWFSAIDLEGARFTPEDASLCLRGLVDLCRTHALHVAVIPQNHSVFREMPELRMIKWDVIEPRGVAQFDFKDGAKYDGNDSDGREAYLVIRERATVHLFAKLHERIWESIGGDQMGENALRRFL